MNLLTPLQIAQTLHAPTDDVLANWPHIEAELAAVDGYSPCVQIAAAATIRVECPQFVPIREYGDDPRFVRLYWENQHVRRMLGNMEPADAATYRGRGYIQITGRDNYHRCGLAIDIDLLNDPDRALEPPVAAKIFVWCFRHCYAAANVGNWTDVRKLVNGGANGLDQFLGYVRALQSISAAKAKAAGA